jgi:hypothetical protein
MYKDQLWFVLMAIMHKKVLRILREAKPDNVEIVDTMDEAAARAAQLAAGVK